jgi:spore photoproduct lyase|tara:strand:+ start:280 stop:1110 length:831 start_codon:yes stop_codon:yes gene_type:complete
MFYQTTKTLKTKDNNNSANCIAPNLIYGCFGGCVDTYCYMSRYNGRRVFINQNVDDIFNSVVEWEKGYTKYPDQQDPVYTMVDIACNTDLVLMQKHMPEPLHDYLKRYDEHPRLNSTMATKYPKLLKLDVLHFNKSPRVRVSLMPQKYSSILEPKMQPIKSRIHDINRLKTLGWEVHVNYSPLVFYPGWKDEYNNLFKKVKKIAGENKCEVIALTNHHNQMTKATPEVQEIMRRSCEVKNKSGVMRYPIKHKTRLLNEFKDIYSQHFNINTIRYIF